jgi:hypothetical protein
VLAGAAGRGEYGGAAGFLLLQGLAVLWTASYAKNHSHRLCMHPV